MHRFYLPSPDITASVIEITDQRVLFQLNKVLRMKPGKQIKIFDENGNENRIEILEINRKKLLGNVIEKVERQTEPNIDVHLYQAIPKKTALFELVIQKATEIGVTHIYPLVTHRTEKHRLSKFERMQSIAIEATEQSRRLKVPIIHHPVAFRDTIEKVAHQAYIGYEYEDSKKLMDYLPQIQKDGVAHLFIGPEGGFEQDEIDFAIKQKANLFTLGPRILRTETAAVVSLGMMLLNE